MMALWVTKINSEGHTYQHMLCFCTQGNDLSAESIIGAWNLMSCAGRHPSIAVLVATHLGFQRRQDPRLFKLLASGKSGRSILLVCYLLVFNKLSASGA